MRIEVNVITENNTRRPDYDGGYRLIEDKGDTMIIEVESNLEERLEQTEQLLQATTLAFAEFIFSQTMGKQHDDN